MHNISLARAVERIGEALHEEPPVHGSYYHSWLCNIAMPILDMRGKLDLTTPEGAEKMAVVLLDHFWPKPKGPTVSMLPPVHFEIVLDKQLRQDLDEILQVLKAANGSRHRSLAITHLEDVIMRLGMDMKVRNESLPPAERSPSPYPSSYDPTTPRVEPTADGLKL